MREERRSDGDWLRLARLVGTIALLAAISAHPVSAAGTDEMSKGHLFDEGTWAETDTERALMRNLVCSCGHCGGMTIDSCDCEFAAKMRKEAKRELASVAKGDQKGAHDLVVAWFVKQYGQGVVVNTSPAALNGAVVFAFGAGIILFAFVIWRSVRASRHAKKARNSPAT